MIFDGARKPRQIIACLTATFFAAPRHARYIKCSFSSEITMGAPGAQIMPKNVIASRNDAVD